MRFNLYTFIFLFFLILSSCSHGQLPVSGHHKFDSLVQLHFPKERALFDLAAFPYLSDEVFVPEDLLNTGAFYRATYELSSLDIPKLKKSFKVKKMLKHKECCFICYNEPKKLYKMDCSESEVPISTFGMERSQLDIKDDYLSSDFDIYIIDADSGIFIPERNLINQTCDNSFDHGFSRGVAISEERGLAIYWVQFW